MRAPSDKRYLAASERQAVLRECLGHAQLTARQMAMRTGRGSALLSLWLRQAEAAGYAVQVIPSRGCVPAVWAWKWNGEDPSPAPVQATPVVLRVDPFADLRRFMLSEKWIPASELRNYAELLEPALAAGVVEKCRRWYVGRPGRPSLLWRLTLIGTVDREGGF